MRVFEFLNTVRTVVSCSDRYPKHLGIYFCCGLLLQFFRNTFVLSLCPLFCSVAKGNFPPAWRSRVGLLLQFIFILRSGDPQVTRGMYATLDPAFCFWFGPGFSYCFVTFVFKAISFFPVLPCDFSCLQ